jgi:hypothetical protein
MKWITRERVKVDRVACPWLIRKFVDKHAEFFFVPAGKVAGEAQRIGAIPFDVKGAELGHHGEECSFEAILKKYNLPATLHWYCSVKSLMELTPTIRSGINPKVQGLKL